MTCAPFAPATCDTTSGDGCYAPRVRALLVLCVCAALSSTSHAQEPDDASSPAVRRAMARADRCAVEIKAHLNAAAERSARGARGRRPEAHLAAARRTVERCATDGDARWGWLASLWIPSDLVAWVEPTSEMQADVARVRRLLATVVGADAPTTRLAAWMALLAGEDAWLEIGPQDPEGAAWLRRAAALRWRRGQRVEAERALRLAARSMPQDPELARDLAALEVARGRADDAAPRLGIARGGRPDDRTLRREHALAWLAAGRGEEALVLLEGLAREDTSPTGDSAGAHEAVGEDTLRFATAALELGRASDAEAAARRAIDRLPDARRSEAHAVRGLALLALGRRAEARAALTAGADDVRARSALEALAPD